MFLGIKGYTQLRVNKNSVMEGLKIKQGCVMEGICLVSSDTTLRHETTP